MTIDDGPSGNSSSVVSAFSGAGCSKVTVFAIGQNVQSSGLSAYKNAGYSIQNHSQTHSHMTSWSYQQVYNDLNSCNSAIQNQGCAKPSRIRLPYLESARAATSRTIGGGRFRRPRFTPGFAPRRPAGPTSARST